MNLASKLKSLREMNKLTKAELSKKLNVPYSTYNNWEIDVHNPQIPDLCMLADYYNISVDSLIGHNAKISEAETQILLQKYGELTENERRLINAMIDTINTLNNEKKLSDNNIVVPDVIPTRDIPLFSQSASAGLGVYLENADTEMLSISDIPEYRQANMAVRVNGDSMLPDYNDGDIVLVCQQPAVDVGEIGIFIYNGEGYIKRLEKEGLVSLNPEYKTIKVDELGSFKTVGKVICSI